MLSSSVSAASLSDRSWRGTLRYTVLRQICAIYTHKGCRQLFDNMTDAQLYNKLSYYGSHKSLNLVPIISYLRQMDTLPHYLFCSHFNILLLLTTRSSLHLFRSIFSPHSSYLPCALRSPNTFSSLSSWLCVCVFEHKSIRIAAQTMTNKSPIVRSKDHYIKEFKTVQIH